MPYFLDEYAIWSKCDKWIKRMKALITSIKKEGGTVMTFSTEFRCPYARVICAGDEAQTMCNLVDKWCLLEGGHDCEYYQQYLDEESQEESSD